MSIEAGQDAHALACRSTVVPGGDRHLRARAHGHDPVARDQHDAVVDGRALVAVDDLAADEGQRRLVGGRGGGPEEKDRARPRGAWARALQGLR